MDTNKIPKLKYDGVNWPSWKVQFGALSIIHSLSPALDADLSASADAKHKELDGRAKSYLLINMDEALALELSLQPSAHQMWQTLVSRFETMSRALKLAKKRAFFAEAMGTGDTVETFIFRLDKLAAELVAQKVKLDDEDKLAVLLNGLAKVPSLGPTVYAIEQDSQSTYAKAVNSFRQSFRSTFVFASTAAPSTSPSVKLEANLVRPEKAAPSRDKRETKPGEPAKYSCDICNDGSRHRYKQCPTLAAARKSRPDNDKKSDKDKKPGKRTKDDKDIGAKLCRLQASAARYDDGTDCFSLDSCATVHFAPLHMIRHACNVQDRSGSNRVILANKEPGPAVKFVGDLFLRTETGTVLLNDVHFAPNMSPLVSMTTWWEEGMTLEPRLASATLGNGQVVPLRVDGNMLQVCASVGNVTNPCEGSTGIGVGGAPVFAADAVDKAKPSPDTLTADTVSAPVPLTRNLLHSRLAHPRPVIVDEVIKQHGLKLDSRDEKQDWCTSCVRGTMSRTPARRSCTGTKVGVLGLLHIDMMESTLPTLGGNSYLTVITDNDTKYRWAVLTRAKSDAADKVIAVMKSVERQVDRKIKAVRVDQGTENAGVRKYCEEVGIEVEETPATEKRLHGHAERGIGVVQQKSRTLLCHANYPLYLWGEAVPTAVYLLNGTPLGPGKPSPYELLFKKRPAFNHLRVFGARAYVRNHRIAPGDKFSQRTLPDEIRMVGYERLGYRLVRRNPTTKRFDKIIWSRDVVFDERDHVVGASGEPDNKAASVDAKVSDAFDTLFVVVDAPHPSVLPTTHAHAENSERVSGVTLSDASHVAHGGGDVRDGGGDDDPPALERPHTDAPLSLVNEDDEEEMPSVAELPSEQVILRRSARSNVGHPPTRLSPDGVVIAHAASTSAGLREPSCWQEAASTERWRSAATVEMDSLRDRGVYSVVNRGDVPPREKVLPSKWVWKQKVDAKGVPTKAKARLVACGNFQSPSDSDNSSPVARSSSVRMLLALSALRRLKLTQYDVTSAYLYADLEKPEYVRPPPGASELGISGLDGKILCLHKALYGLRQSGKAWNKLLNSKLLEAGLQQSRLDRCLYFSLKPFALVVIIVDDIFVACEASALERKIHGVLSKYFEVNRDPDPSSFIGLAIHALADGIHVSLPGYIVSVLERFGMESCKSEPTPAAENQDFGPRRDEEEKADIKDYQALVGCLGYIAGAVRCDIQYPYRSLSAHVADPAVRHMTAAKRVLRYLSGTRDLGLLYRYDGGHSLVAYSDADHGSAQHSRYSITGAVVKLAGAPVCVVSRRQEIITLSSTEAELVAASETAKQVVYLRMLMEEIGVAQREPTTIREDNQGVVSISKTDAFSGRTKHIDIRHKYVCEATRDRKVHVEWVSTKEQVADILTKALPKRQFEYLRNMMGIC
jgi:hypothetical protein